MAGPETSLALGRPDLGQLAPLTDPAAATAPTNIAPTADALAQGQQQASRTYNLDPNYRPAAEPRNRPQLKQTGFLGTGQMAAGQASGGDPLWAATMAVPTFELDRSLSNVRQQKADIEKWMAEATGQFKGRAADPYQKAYQDYVSQEHDKFFQDVADTYYGGDRRKAIEATHRDPELNRQWQNVNRSLGAIGDANKSGYAYYEKVDKAIRDGNAEVDPETKQLLDQGLNGEWAFNGQSPAHNAAQFDRLNDRLSMNKLFDSFYEKNVNNAGDKTEGWSVQKDPKTGRKFLVVDSEKNYDDFVDSFVEQAMKDGPYRDKEEARRFVEARVPRENTLRVDQLALGSKGSSGSSPADKVWSSPVTQAKTNIGAPLTTTEKRDGYQRRTPVNETMAVGKIVGDRQEPFGVLSFKKGADIVRMNWASIDRGPNGEFVLVGTDPADTETATNIDNLNAKIGDLNAIIRSPYDEPEAKAKATAERDKLLNELRTTQKRSKMVVVPLKGNESAADGYLGGTLQQKLAQFGETKQSQQANTSPEDFNAKWAKLPKGGKLVGPDGVTYEKK